MTPSRAVVWLSALIAILSLVAALAGLFSSGGDGRYTFTSVRGETIDMFGQGLYRHDTLFAGAANKGTDVVTLLLGLPLLIGSALQYLRGSLRGGLLLMGAFTWLLYVYASAALASVAYNDLFLIYVILFAGSLFALVLAFRSFDHRTLASHFRTSMPRRGPAIFLIASGVATLAIWLMDPIAALFEGGPPTTLQTQTTLFTNALDMAIIVPLCLMAAGLILRRDSEGYLIAVPLLVLESMLAPMIVLQTISKVEAGVTFTPGAIIGPIAGFVLLALVAIWMIVSILRSIAPTPLHPNPSQI